MIHERLPLEFVDCSPRSANAPPGFSRAQSHEARGGWTLSRDTRTAPREDLVGATPPMLSVLRNIPRKVPVYGLSGLLRERGPWDEQQSCTGSRAGSPLLYILFCSPRLPVQWGPLSGPLQIRQSPPMQPCLNDRHLPSPVPPEAHVCRPHFVLCCPAPPPTLARGRGRIFNRLAGACGIIQCWPGRSLRVTEPRRPGCNCEVRHTSGSAVIGAGTWL